MGVLHFLFTFCSPSPTAPKETAVAATSLETGTAANPICKHVDSRVGQSVYEDGSNERSEAKSLYVSSFMSAFLQIGGRTSRGRGGDADGGRVYGCQFGLT